MYCQSCRPAVCQPSDGFIGLCVFVAGDTIQARQPSNQPIYEGVLKTVTHDSLSEDGNGVTSGSLRKTVSQA